MLGGRYSGDMPLLISTPTRIAAAGNKPKLIDEFVGRVNTGTQSVSVARMQSPAGWEEPGQAPEFDEVTLVLEGMGAGWSIVRACWRLSPVRRY